MPTIDEMRAEWLAILEAEYDRRQRKIRFAAEADERAREAFFDQLVVMGDRLLADPDIDIGELLEARGDRQRFEAMLERRDMSKMAGVALLLQFDVEAACALLDAYAEEAAQARAMRRTHG